MPLLLTGCTLQQPSTTTAPSHQPPAATSPTSEGIAADRHCPPTLTVDNAGRFTSTIGRCCAPDEHAGRDDLCYCDTGYTRGPDKFCAPSNDPLGILNQPSP